MQGRVQCLSLSLPLLNNCFPNVPPYDTLQKMRKDNNKWWEDWLTYSFSTREDIRLYYWDSVDITCTEKNVHPIITTKEIL